MTWIYTIVSVFIISLISLVGVFALSIDQKKLYKVLIYLVSFSAGTLMGDAFLHLIPEAFENSQNTIEISFSILGGILIFFLIEKIIRWRHCHEEPCEQHPHPFSYVILIGDSIHNFIDGMIIATSFLVSVPLGIATTTAVIFHEIPQEIGDFASLIYAGFSRAKALFFNFLTALTAILGAIVILAINLNTADLTAFLVPFAAGGFIYIAGTDLIPELHKHRSFKAGFWQTIAFVLGMGLMAWLLMLE
ncbi:MAG: ZIP family metal transporter [Candidatus Moranbacteria bacterium CG23_combo_of_CG06-09_8_20_14_all_35_22]|nr:MAG: ZIP family metal transporter [Candidatus Moranbacteria bacterium CG23_combo_of_CG06-09_8_20_14_all_35_22]